MKPIRSIKVALVGAGYMASEHANAFFGLPDVRLVGVTGRCHERAVKLASQFTSMQVFDSVETMYRQTNADLVIVAVNEMSMSKVAIECFRYPWAVLLEKPAGYNLKDARLILEAARKNASRVWVALNRRAYSSTRQALERLKRVDGPRFIRVADQQDQEAARDVYDEPPEVIQNYMYANSIHLIDYLRVFGRGDVTNVTQICAWTPEAPWMVVSKVEFSSGDVGLYEGIWNGPGPWAVTVMTHSESLEMRPLEQISLQLRGERKVTHLQIDAKDSDYKPGLRLQAMGVLDALRGEESRIATLDDAFLSMNLVAEIFGLSEPK